MRGTEMNPNLKITKWLRTGTCANIGESETVADLLGGAGRLLEKAYSGDIVGDILFQGEDGKYYAGSVEFNVYEADPEYVAECLAELDEQDGGTRLSVQQIRDVKTWEAS